MRITINSKQIKSLPSRSAALLSAVILLFGIVMPVVLKTQASAASVQLQSRSLTISSSANGTITTDLAGNAVPAGEGGNGQKTKQTYKYTVKSAQNVGSILIKFCDDPIAVDATSGPGDGTCNAPTGLSASTITSIVAQSINGTANSTTPFTVDTTTVLTGAPWGCAGSSPGRQNCIALTRTAAAVVADDVYQFEFGGTSGQYVTNPTADNAPFFARIQQYDNNNFTTKGDYGSVAASTAQQIDITAKVKEVLNFSVAANAANVTAPGATCTPLTTGSTTGAMQLGDTNGVLSFNVAYDAHSYFRLSTNTNGGVQVLYSGDTLKNGSNSIAAIGTTATASAVGTAQFGLAIDSGDTTPNGYNFTAGLTAATVGSPSGSLTNYSGGAGTITNGGTALFGFNTASKTTPVVLAYAAGPVGCNTGSVRYLGNISTATPAGIYTTTITYIATGIY